MEESELIGKRLRYIKEPHTPGKKVIDIKEDMVFFEDHGRTPLSIVKELFEEVQNVPDKVVMNTGYSTSDVVNPDNFFNTTTNAMAESISNFQTGASSSIKPVGNIKPSEEVYHNQEFDANDQDMANQLHPDTLAAIKRQQQEDIAKMNQKNQPDTWLDSQFSDNGGMKKVNTGDMAKQLENAKNGIVDTPVNNTTAPSQNNNPSFPKMKKSTKAKLNILIEEMIPKPESIKNLNDLFEESIIDVLAKEIADKYLADPQLLENLIGEELERIVYKKRVKRTPTKKTPTKKTEAKKTTKATKTKKDATK